MGPHPAFNHPCNKDVLCLTLQGIFQPRWFYTQIYVASCHCLREAGAALLTVLHQLLSPRVEPPFCRLSLTALSSSPHASASLVSPPLLPITGLQHIQFSFTLGKAAQDKALVMCPSRDGQWGRTPEDTSLHLLTELCPKQLLATTVVWAHDWFTCHQDLMTLPCKVPRLLPEWIQHTTKPCLTSATTTQSLFVLAWAEIHIQPRDSPNACASRLAPRPSYTIGVVQGIVLGRGQDKV